MSGSPSILADPPGTREVDGPPSPFRNPGLRALAGLKNADIGPTLDTWSNLLCLAEKVSIRPYSSTSGAYAANRKPAIHAGLEKGMFEPKSRAINKARLANFGVASHLAGRVGRCSNHLNEVHS
jgi:hypothetical protein